MIKKLLLRLGDSKIFGIVSFTVLTILFIHIFCTFMAQAIMVQTIRDGLLIP